VNRDWSQGQGGLQERNSTSSVFSEFPWGQGVKRGRKEKNPNGENCRGTVLIKSSAREGETVKGGLDRHKKKERAQFTGKAEKIFFQRRLGV